MAEARKPGWFKLCSGVTADRHQLDVMQTLLPPPRHPKTPQGQLRDPLPSFLLPTLVSDRYPGKETHHLIIKV